MRMKAKTYGIKLLVTSHLQLNIFSCKWFATKFFIPYVLAPFSSWNVYKQDVLSLHFHIYKHGHMGWTNESDLT